MKPGEEGYSMNFVQGQGRRDQEDPLARIEAWFGEHCDGDWEHTYGIVLETVDNPGWLLKIDLKDTPLYRRPFEIVSHRTSDTDWLHCAVSDGVYQASGGLGRLRDLFEHFLDWATQDD